MRKAAKRPEDRNICYFCYVSNAALVCASIFDEQAMQAFPATGISSHNKLIY